MQEKISVVIPTYNRVEDLKECLNSIFNQTVLPQEVIIVDNAKNNNLEKIILNFSKKIKKKNIILKYIRNEKENSANIARNIGVENSTGEIIFVFDDDIILKENYIEKILIIYKTYPQAKCVQGYIENKKQISKLGNFLCRLFFLDNFQKNKCQILVSVSGIYPSILDKTINCQWLSGANHSFKKEIFKEIKYDENLKKYSDGDDIEFSYRIFKKYPNSLYMTPEAKLIHKVSKEGRSLEKELIFMKEIYNLYLFYKLFEPTFKNKLIYIWSRLGKIIFVFISAIFHFSKSRLLKVNHLIKAYLVCFINLKQIKKGDLSFFNKTLIYKE